MSERSVKDTRPSDSYLPVVNVDPLTGLSVPVGGALGAGTAAGAMRVTYASDGATVPVKTSRLPLWATGQVLTTSATSAATTAITGTEVLISTTADIWIKIGAATPVAALATAGSMFLEKGGPYLFQITSGQMVAAVQDVAAGKVSVVPVA